VSVRESVACFLSDSTRRRTRRQKGSSLLPTCCSQACWKKKVSPPSD
jgi:hypothetical protein